MSGGLIIEHKKAFSNMPATNNNEYQNNFGTQSMSKLPGNNTLNM